MRLDEESIAELLAERAATLRTAPDLGDLATRLAAREARARRRHRAALAAALVVVATSIGGIVGALTGHGLGRIEVIPSESHPGNTLADGAPPGERQLGALGHRTTAPAPNHRPTGAAWRTLVERTTAAGLVVVARTERTVPPVAVAADGRPLACLSAAPVEVEVARAGLLGGGDALAGMPPLSPDGLAVVGSGQFEDGGQTGWWAVLESGSAGHAVAGEYASAIDETVPAEGLSVLAGLTPAGVGGTADPYASAVVSGRDGQVLSSLAFRLGGGPVAVGTASSGGSASAAVNRSCPLYGGAAGGPATVTSDLRTPPGARSALTAAAGVVEAFVQAYTPDPVFGYVLNAGAVSGGPLWTGAGEAAAARRAPSGAAGGEGGLPGVDVAVYEVDFVKPGEAVVAYRLRGGALETGTTVGGSGTGGRWLVSQATYCADSALTAVRCR